MGLVRVAPVTVGRLVRVRLSDVDERWRLLVSRRVREKRWDDELRPDVGYSPTMKQRFDALLDAALLERAARAPSERDYLVPEDVVADVLAKHGAAA